MEPIEPPDDNIHAQPKKLEVVRNFITPKVLLITGVFALTGAFLTSRIWAVSQANQIPVVNEICSLSHEFKYTQQVGDVCALPDGLSKVRLKDDTFIVTRGFEPIPENAPKQTPPRTDKLNSAAGATLGATTPACATDYYIKVIIANPYGYPNTYTQKMPIVRDTVHEANGMIRAEGNRFGVPMDLKFLCDSSGAIAIDNVQLGPQAGGFASIVSDIKAKGYNNPKVKYWIWVNGDGSPGGTSSYILDDSPGVGNRNNGNDTSASYSVTWSTVGTVGAANFIHEGSHALGAVQPSAPHYKSGAHCTDGSELVCYGGNPPVKCSNEYWQRFDCNNDDYFHPNPPAGSYLATKWNIGASYNRYISRGGTTTTPPTPPPVSPPTPPPVAPPNPPPTNPGVSMPTGNFSLLNKNKCLDIQSYTDGAQATQWDCNTGSWQSFSFRAAGGNYYNIVSRYSGKCLDYGNTDNWRNGGKIHQWACHGGQNQLFSFQSLGNNQYKIIGKAGGRCLDSPFNTNGGALHQWDCVSNNINQVFSTRMIGGTVTPPPVDVTAPPTPTGLRSSGTTAKSIQLTWNATSDTIGYKIYRNGIQIDTTSITRYTNSGLVPRTTYSYRVAAYDAAGNTSGLSPAVSVTTQSCSFLSFSCQ